MKDIFSNQLIIILNKPILIFLQILQTRNLVVQYMSSLRDSVRLWLLLFTNVLSLRDKYHLKSMVPQGPNIGNTKIFSIKQSPRGATYIASIRLRSIKDVHHVIQYMSSLRDSVRLLQMFSANVLSHTGQISFEKHGPEGPNICTHLILRSGYYH